MLAKFKACLRDENGQGMTEYILIVVLIAIAAIAAFIYFRGILKTKVNTAGTDLSGAT
ncbi:Flp family type IVb pilin [candidate division CSSED10-310 bacterium]|uniref:Flp family type IVb pilin n=1 Tax=candidate division CSSED10-310 bacterium TaxID=2855610 RepID=A0ABV6Z0I1_UNCC1